MSKDLTIIPVYHNNLAGNIEHGISPISEAQRTPEGNRRKGRARSRIGTKAAYQSYCTGRQFSRFSRPIWCPTHIKSSQLSHLRGLRTISNVPMISLKDYIYNSRIFS